MKVVNEDKLIIYLTNKYLSLKKISNIEDTEECFKDIFAILKNKYNIKLSGFYDIDVYKDDTHGVVIEIAKEDFDFDYYCDQIDMKIIIHYTTFLYKVDDLEQNKSKKIYLYKKNYYINKIDNVEFGKLTYKTDDIIKNAKCTFVNDVRQNL